MDNEKTIDEGQAAEEVVEIYSVFTTAEKWCIVAMVSFAA
jgi:hypothetical protein